MDSISKTQRSNNMFSIKSKNTKPELVIRKLLHAKGYRFKIHDKKLPGKPDIVMPKHKVVVNVHGCYWHYHGCNRSNIPKTHTQYWIDKLEGNKKRDFINKKKLEKLGFKVIELWECTLKKKELNKTFLKLEQRIAC
jgi:DNA mismatch endonuclease (patch repair protein)|tara:strand:- start:25 stop:435 length:411 start_codon:yes stop_codon:yes gene_type:complete